MGAFSSTLGRRNGGVEIVDIPGNNAYKYPPKSGNYFGSHFIMGGERFDMSQPEAYLFGENTDLNFLGNKPVPFPYPPAAGNEPTKTLKSLVNIRKDSLRLVRIPEAEKLVSDEKDDTLSNKYNLEFIFDCDVKCSIKIYYFCTEEISNSQISYTSKQPGMSSEVYHYKRGAMQVFQQSSHVIDPSRFSDEQWQYTPEREDIPVVIQCLAEDEDNSCHAHMTFAVIERSSLDGGYIIKPLKQKQFVHGLCYLLQEIYGIENKNDKIKEEEDGEDELEDSGAECVICMSDMRDTLILPCRHLCLCSTCAESLRYQASSCPICRSPFRALLQIRAMRKKQAVALQQGEQHPPEETPVSQEGVPLGYEAVSLIEALNGPCGLPPFSTMEGIHVPPPSRYPQLDNESHQKRRSSKKPSAQVETVKELHMVSTEENKVPEDKEPERTESQLQTKPTGHKGRTRTSRQRKNADSDNLSLPRSPSSDQEKTDNMKVVNELDQTEAKTPGGREELAVTYPPLTVSSENLADDEREDTSDGEGEPAPDYDLDDCCGLPEEGPSGDSDNDEDDDNDDDDSDDDDDDDDDDEEEEDQSQTQDYNNSYLPPPDYSTVMKGVERSSTVSPEDTDSGASVKLHLSTSPHGSSDSTSSQLSTHMLLDQPEAQ